MLKRISLIMVALLLLALMAGCGGGGDEEIISAPVISGEGDAPDEDTTFAAISLDSQLGATAGGSGTFTVNTSAPEVFARAINEKRCEAGRTPIAVNGLLNQAAETHSRYLAGDATLNSDGEPGTMISDTGYVRSCGWQVLMCGGYNNDPMHYFNHWWNNSPNALLSNYQEIGVGLITNESGFSYISLITTSPATPITLPSCSDLGF